MQSRAFDGFRIEYLQLLCCKENVKAPLQMGPTLVAPDNNRLIGRTNRWQGFDVFLEKISTYLELELQQRQRRRRVVSGRRRGGGGGGERQRDEDGDGGPRHGWAHLGWILRRMIELMASVLPTWSSAQRKVDSDWSPWCRPSSSYICIS